MSELRGRWIIPSNVNEVIAACKTAPLVGLDTETTALHPKDGKLRLIQIAVPGCVYILDAWKHDPRLLLPLFDGETRFVGHNLAFDLLFLDSVGLTLPHGKKIFDTMIVGQVLDAGLMPQPSHSLEAMVSLYLGIQLDKTEQLSDWSLPVLSKEQVRYAARDADVLLPLARHLKKKLEHASLVNTMNLEMRALPGMMWLTKSGIRLDVQGWRELAVINKDKVDRLERALADQTDTADINGYSLINWRSPLQVVDVFNRKFVKEGRGTRKKVQLPCEDPRCKLFGKECRWHGKPGFKKIPYTIDNADNEVLGQLAADGDELAKLLMKYRKTVKARDTYGIGFLNQYLAPDGRLYPSWHQIGAATGRMASSNPNGQNIPHSDEFRRLFLPDEGHVFALADYSQIEFRIAIEMSKDPFGMKGYCSDGTDVHLETAKLILGLDVNTASKEQIKEARQIAKSLNFGLIFGAGSEALRLYAMSSYDVILTPQRAAELRNKWRELYKGIVAWQQIQGNGPNVTYTLGGRRVQGVNSFMAKLNYPVQGTGIDGLKAGIALCYETRHEINSAAHPSMYVHDEILFSTPRHAGQDTALWIQKNMERGMRAFMKTVPTVAEPKVASSWAEK